MVQAFGNQAEQLFVRANEAFQNDDFEKAAEMYRQVLELGFQSAELEYNLANAYYRQELLGQAILHYERALLLDPDDDDIIHNLDIARSQVTDEIQPLPTFFLTSWWKKMRMFAASSVWAVTALALWWAGFVGLVFWLFGKSREQKKRGFLIGITCLAVSILPFALSLSRKGYEQNTKQGIILVGETALRSAPDAAGAEIVLLHEGTKVKLLDQLSGWWQVQLPNGEKGWLDGEDVEGI